MRGRKHQLSYSLLDNCRLMETRSLRLKQLCHHRLHNFRLPLAPKTP